MLKPTPPQGSHAGTPRFNFTSYILEDAAPSPAFAGADSYTERVRREHPDYTPFMVEAVAYQLEQADEEREEKRRLDFLRMQSLRSELKAQRITAQLVAPSVTSPSGETQSLWRSRVWLMHHHPEILEQHRAIISRALSAQMHERIGYSDECAQRSEDELRRALAKKDARADARVARQRLHTPRDRRWEIRAHTAKASMEARREDEGLAADSRIRQRLEDASHRLDIQRCETSRQLCKKGKVLDEKFFRLLSEREQEDEARFAEARSHAQNNEGKKLHAAAMLMDVAAHNAFVHGACLLGVQEAIAREDIAKAALTFLNHLVREARAVYRVSEVSAFVAQASQNAVRRRQHYASARIKCVRDQDERIRTEMAHSQISRVNAAAERAAEMRENQSAQLRERSLLAADRAREGRQAADAALESRLDTVSARQHSPRQPARPEPPMIPRPPSPIKHVPDGQQEKDLEGSLRAAHRRKCAHVQEVSGAARRHLDHGDTVRVRRHAALSTWWEAKRSKVYTAPAASPTKLDRYMRRPSKKASQERERDPGRMVEEAFPYSPRDTATQQQDKAPDNRPDAFPSHQPSPPSPRLVKEPTEPLPHIDRFHKPNQRRKHSQDRMLQASQNRQANLADVAQRMRDHNGRVDAVCTNWLDDLRVRAKTITSEKSKARVDDAENRRVEILSARSEHAHTMGPRASPRGEGPKFSEFLQSHREQQTEAQKGRFQIHSM